MFIGHFGAGLAAKKFAPRVSLGTLFLAAQFIDLLWPTLLLLGVERVRIAPGVTPGVPLVFEHYPVSHSLLAVVLWGILLGGLYFLRRREVRGALVIGLAVVSHWALDLVVHVPDLPVFPGGTKVGLGLWESVPATLVVELALFAVGVWLYVRATKPTDATGRWALVGLIIALVGIHLVNVFGAPPPSVTAIAIVGHAQWLLVLWAYWIDRHRVVR
jgi:FtsH-binding integral membrane protein